ncbi:hypothetical protein B7H23_04205 [Notoacmeibacter marinus]|uniref:HTH lysR-type domain-containing protein n=1 Tax=Notoacmeibacter marinus TaxID=1876515 RepID=A0A231V1S4_9HYPH|nr:LysR family transcriptional regulator [Notoacmeibacter marinus]OXT02133.1 hypothetical protein B7H23_04205 [Notoacmeibacter marinus]
MSFAPNYRAIHLFLTVASEGTFSAAADRLGMSQPSLSQQIAKLEKELGQLLFHRGGRRLSLTPTGQTLKQTIGAAFGQIDQAWSEVRSQTSAVDSLVLASVHTLFTYFLPELLPSYLETAPHVRPDLRARSSADVVALARGRTVDVGFVYDTQNLHDDLASEMLFREDIVAVFHPSAPWADQLRQTKRLATNIPVIAFQNGYAIRSLLNRATRENPLHIRAEVDSVNLTLRLAEAQYGVALMPKGVAVGRAAGLGLIHAELEYPRLKRHVVAIWRNDEQLRPHARDFLDHCKREWPAKS